MMEGSLGQVGVEGKNGEGCLDSVNTLKRLVVAAEPRAISTDVTLRRPLSFNLFQASPLIAALCPLALHHSISLQNPRSPILTSCHFFIPPLDTSATPQLAFANSRLASCTLVFRQGRHYSRSASHRCSERRCLSQSICQIETAYKVLWGYYSNRLLITCPLRGTTRESPPHSYSIGILCRTRDSASRTDKCPER